MQYIVLSLKVSKDEKIVLSRWHVVNSTICFLVWSDYFFLRLLREVRYWVDR